MADKVSKIIEEAASKAAEAASKAAEAAGVAGKAALGAAEKAAASPAAKAVAEAVSEAAGAAGSIARGAVGGAREKAAKLAGDAAAKLAEARSALPFRARPATGPRVVCFGEIMMRLNPPGCLRFAQAHSFEASYTGGEANAAVSLAHFGVDAAFVSKVPKHDVGQAAINALRQHGVDTSRVLRGGDRLGICFIEKGAPQRASKVIYDRADSAFASAGANEYDWDAILAGATWFHFTGVTPALGANAAEACKNALEAARRMKATVSCDLSYRRKLWGKEKAGEAMASLMPYVDVCIASEGDAADMFGIRAEGAGARKGEDGKGSHASVARQLMERFGFKSVAIILRGARSAGAYELSGLLYNGEAFFAKTHRVRSVDRVAISDSFSAGLVYALLSGYDSQRAVDFATAASCLKQSIEYDFNLASVQEVSSLAAGDASGGRARR